MPAAARTCCCGTPLRRCGGAYARVMNTRFPFFAMKLTLLWLLPVVCITQTQLLQGQVPDGRKTYEKVLALAHKVPVSARVDAPRAVLGLAGTYLEAAAGTLATSRLGDGGGMLAVARATTADDPVLAILHTLAAAVETSFSPLGKALRKAGKAARKLERHGKGNAQSKSLGAAVVSSTRVMKARTSFGGRVRNELSRAAAQVAVLCDAMATGAPAGSATSSRQRVGRILSSLIAHETAEAAERAKSGSQEALLFSAAAWARGSSGASPLVHLVACRALFECVLHCCPRSRPGHACLVDAVRWLTGCCGVGRCCWCCP